MMLKIASGITFLCYGAVLAILPLFYPSESEKRGVHPSEYGLAISMISLGSIFGASLFSLFGRNIAFKWILCCCSIIQLAALLSFSSLVFVNNISIFIIASCASQFIFGLNVSISESALIALLMNIFPGTRIGCIYRFEL